VFPAVTECLDMGGKIWKIDPIEPEQAAIREAAGIIRRGGVVVFPTTGLYGLGADGWNVDAIERVFHVKNRPAANPILILVPDAEVISTLVEEIPSEAREIIHRFWPGSVTLVFRARSPVSPLLTAGTGKIGIRLPAHPAAAQLVSTVGAPITGTSANLSGEPGVSNVGDLPGEIIDRVDMVLDAGSLQGGQGSTVVDVTTDPPTVLREGMVSAARMTQPPSGRY